MSNSTAPQDEQLWDSWIKDQDSDAANQLIQKYSYIVSYHVQRIGVHLPSSVSRDDIKSLGLVGLYDALTKFDPKRDLKFDTYASFRVRGAIIDGLRKEDWLPRSVREKTKQLDRVSNQLEQQLQRKPSAEEIAKELGIPEKEVEEIIKDSLFANVLSMDDKPKDNGKEQREGIGYSVPDESTATPEQNIVRKESYVELEQGIKKLNENEQMVISLFYKEELTFTEIGQVLGLTTSRISQIHRKSIVKLQQVLANIS
ncbi:FliA/WhiG family RNA polymerase sigma factor [Radiobacillus kanasensis]|uniref:FliA/WhiG family RNA polymerase sigma factor n=1 Tax=Radiobacillus kanasensis TaxID=2844358 RepID=UPI001E5E21C1|nr:FliA/WhiG family RNA polymerase sigma factor [Radiobacillus kanasensis]UFU01049.1 FliA/WhiG family RNA polymerase sigma factor [Radiobacillus kanasensis]